MRRGETTHFEGFHRLLLVIEVGSVGVAGIGFSVPVIAKINPTASIHFSDNFNVGTLRHGEDF